MRIPVKWGFALEVVELGADADGDPVTATVATPCAAPSITGKLTERRRIVFQALLVVEAIRTNGAAITYEDWREQAYRLLPGQNQRRDFKAGADWLIANGWASHLDGFVTSSPNIVIPPEIRCTLADVAFAARRAYQPYQVRTMYTSTAVHNSVPTVPPPYRVVRWYGTPQGRN